jgi:hypothetical protein
MLPWVFGGLVGAWFGFKMFHAALAALTFAVLGGVVGSAIAKSRVFRGARRGDGSGSSSDGADFAWSDGGSSCDSSDGGGTVVVVIR